MTNCLSYRISAMVMALLMFVSSIGISMDVHYCQDQLRGISLFGEAKSCHEKQADPPCHKSKKTCHHKDDISKEVAKDDCCHNERIVIEKTDAEATSPQLVQLQDIDLTFFASFVAVYLSNSSIETQVVSYLNYKPPLPDRDVQILYQSFLI